MYNKFQQRDQDDICSKLHRIEGELQAIQNNIKVLETTVLDIQGLLQHQRPPWHRTHYRRTPYYHQRALYHRHRYEDVKPSASKTSIDVKKKKRSPSPSPDISSPDQASS